MNKSRIETLAKNYEKRRHEVLFDKEEKDLRSRLDKTDREIDRMMDELTDLEANEKEDPGDAPEYESYVAPTAKTILSIWIVALICVIIIHCIIWVLNIVFNIPWETWNWVKSCFWYGLYAMIIGVGCASIVYGIAYKIWSSRKDAYTNWAEACDNLIDALDRRAEESTTLSHSLADIINDRMSVLGCAFNLTLALPMRSVEPELFKAVHKEFFLLLDSRSKLNSISDPKAHLDELFRYYDSKLDLFYRRSIPSEAMSKTSLDAFKKALNAVDDKRATLTLPIVDNSAILALKNNLSEHDDNDLDKLIDKFNLCLDEDTSGFFTKHDSKLLENQVNKLNQIFNQANTFFTNFSKKTANKVNETLLVARLLAYRNIYLGAELLNIVREGSGGGKLTTAADNINTSIDLSNIDISIPEFSSSEAMSDIFNSSLGALDTAVQTLFSDKDARKFALENPKSAALAAAGAMAFNAIEAGIEAWKQRNAKIEALLQQEESLIKNMENIVDGYLSALPASKRALELIEAIVKANAGFTHIYNPIAKKVFNDKKTDAISYQELYNLTLAIGEYKKISDSNL